MYINVCDLQLKSAFLLADNLYFDRVDLAKEMT